MGMETDNPFEKVLDRLREKGWNQKRWGGPEGPNCMYGAIYYTQPGQALSESWMSQMLYHIVGDQYRNRVNDNMDNRVMLFNDHPDTTFSDIERVLEKAAVKWEEERVMRG